MDEEVVIKALTYNIFIRPPGVRSHGSDFKDARLKHFLHFEMDKWDIVALQELFGSYTNRKEKFMKKSEKLWGFRYFVSSPPPPKCSKRFVDGGLLIASKYPIMDSDFIMYTKGSFSDALAAKGALYAKVRLHEHGPIFHVFTTHLQASYDEKQCEEKFFAIRQSQLLQLRDFITSKTNHDSYPVLLMGDLNVPARDRKARESIEYLTMLKILRNSHFYITDLIKTHYGYHPHTAGSSFTLSKTGQHTKCLDYILVLRKRKHRHSDIKKIELETGHVVEFVESPIMEFNVNQPNFELLSDHYAVACIMSVTRKNKPVANQ